MTINVYGARDDLIEVEGDITEEFYLKDDEEGDLLAFSDGAAETARLDVERARVAINTERAKAGHSTAFCVECGDEMTATPTPTGVRLEHLNGRTDHRARLWVEEAGKPFAPAAVDRVVANLRAAREPVYDPTDPVQVAAVERLRAEARPVEITCPMPRCDARAWRMPDGNPYCERIGGVPVLPEELAHRPTYAGYAS